MTESFDNVPRPSPYPVVQMRLPLSRPWLYMVLLGLIVSIFAGQVISELVLDGVDLPMALGAKINEYIIRGELWRLFTPVLLHGGLMHIAFNAYALYVLGQGIESLFGTPRFAVIYGLSAVAGNVMSFVFTPEPSVGASTALFGLIASELAFFYRNRDILGELGQRRLMNIIMVIVINFGLGLMPSSNIDNFGHLGGFICGAALGWLLCPQYEIQPMGLGGWAHLVDRNSLQRALPGVVMVALVIAAIATGAILARL